MKDEAIGYIGIGIIFTTFIVMIIVLLALSNKKVIIKEICGEYTQQECSAIVHVYKNRESMHYPKLIEQPTKPARSLEH